MYGLVTPIFAKYTRSHDEKDEENTWIVWRLISYMGALAMKGKKKANKGAVHD